MPKYRGVANFEDTPYTLMARVCAAVASGAASPVAREGTLVIQSDVSSISCKAYDADGAVIVSLTPTVSDVIYNTLQTSGVFQNLVNGGNFRYQVPATAFPTGDTIVTLEVTFTLVGGEVIRAVWEVPVINLNQS